MSSWLCWCTDEMRKKSFGNLTLLLCKTWAIICYCFVHQHDYLITWLKTIYRQNSDLWNIQCNLIQFKLIGTDQCGIRWVKVVMPVRHRTWPVGNHGNPTTVHHLAPVTLTKSMDNTYLDHIFFILTKEEGGRGIKVVKRLSADTYGCHVALQAIRWPCKLWGAPTVSKRAGIHALSLTLPKLRLATLTVEESSRCR